MTTNIDSSEASDVPLSSRQLVAPSFVSQKTGTARLQSARWLYIYFFGLFISLVLMRALLM